MSILIDIRRIHARLNLLLKRMLGLNPIPVTQSLHNLPCCVLLVLNPRTSSLSRPCRFSTYVY